MAILKPTATTMEEIVGLPGTFIRVLNPTPAAIPSTTPMTPPIRQRITLSVINCMRMADAGAPSALRVPISRVRSVTETIMMFITPMPPTSSEMAAMAEMPRDTVFSISVMLSTRLEMLDALTVQLSL